MGWAGPRGATGAGPRGPRERRWAKSQVPPAPYLNFWQNLAGQWVDFLRGASITNWTRRPWGAAPLFQNNSDFAFAVDTVTQDNAAPFYRYAVAGTLTLSGTPTPQVRVSRHGLDWVDRSTSLVGSGVVGAIAGIAFVNGQWWMWGANGGVGWLVTTPADDLTHSAIGEASVAWTSAGFSTTPVRGFAGDTLAFSAGGRLAAVVDYGGSGPSVYFSLSNGAPWIGAVFDATWSALAPSGLDIVWSGAAFVTAGWSGRLILARAVNPSDTWATTYQDTTAPAPSGSATWKLASDGNGTVVAWPYEASGGASIYVSTDHGVTWSKVSLPTSYTVELLTGFRFRDGQWIFCQCVAPLLWASNDLANWTPLIAPVTEDADISPRALAYADGGWCVVGNGFTYWSTRATDPASGAYTPGTAPAAYTDAAALRGVPLDVGAPTDGQTYVFNASTGRFALAAAGGGSGLPAGAAGQVPQYTGVGSTIAAHTLTQADLAVTVLDLSSATGWSVVPGDRGGAAGISGSAATLTLAAATMATFDSGGGDHAPRIAHDGVVPGSGRDFTYMARVAAVSWTGANAFTNVGIYLERADSTRYACLTTSDGSVFAVQLSTNTNLGSVGAGSFAGAGTGWLKLVSQNGRFAFFCGRAPARTPGHLDARVVHHDQRARPALVACGGVCPAAQCRERRRGPRVV